MNSEAWRPNAGVEVARHRSQMLARARHYFATTNVLEVDVPALNGSAVSDPNIDSIPAHPAIFAGEAGFLHTSPEYAMKRLLAAGFPDIGSICHVFRDAESGKRHQPEFTMIEWYRLDFGLDEIIEDTLRLICEVVGRDFGTRDFQRISYTDAFEQFAGLNPLTADNSDLTRTSGAGESLQAALGDDRDAWLDLLMATKIAPRFDPTRLTVIDHYPASQGALARACPSDPSVADRFEVFYGELELANGYVELTDAAEQQRRFQSDLAKRVQLGKPTHALDHALLDALASGLPPCAGVAVGFDRLLMLSLEADDIRDVCHFPHGKTS